MFPPIAREWLTRVARKSLVPSEHHFLAKFDTYIEISGMSDSGKRIKHLVCKVEWGSAGNWNWKHSSQ
jgi:hypothetical protein